MLQQRREHARAEERNEGELDEGEKTTLQWRMRRREEKSSALLEDRKGGPTHAFYPTHASFPLPRNGFRVR